MFEGILILNIDVRTKEAELSSQLNRLSID